MKNIKWTPEMDAELLRLWQSGLNASQVAAEMGMVSRSAVLGKVHRLGIQRYKLPAPRNLGKIRKNSWTELDDDLLRSMWKDGVPRDVICRRLGRTVYSVKRRAGDLALRRPANGEWMTQRQRPKFTFKQSPKERRPPTIPLPRCEVIQAESRMLTIMELEFNSCRWPIGDPMTEEFRFCGADAGGIGIDCYCPAHRALASTVYRRHTPEHRAKIAASMRKRYSAVAVSQ